MWSELWNSKETRKDHQAKSSWDFITKFLQPSLQILDGLYSMYYRFAIRASATAGYKHGETTIGSQCNYIAPNKRFAYNGNSPDCLKCELTYGYLDALASAINVILVVTVYRTFKPFQYLCVPSAFNFLDNIVPLNRNLIPTP